jgi:hypothetical protein
MLKKKIVCVCVTCILILQFVYAQDSNTQLSQLDMLIGTWKVKAEMRLSANGPCDTSVANAVITKTTGDKLIAEDYTGTLNKNSFFTKSLIAFDHFKNVFQREFIDSEHGVLVDYEGQKNNDTIFFDKTWVYANGSTVKLRVVYKFISNNEFTIENMRMPADSVIWDTTSRLRYIRSK